MKDQLITILEAVRLAKAELMTHETRRVKNGPRTVKRLKEILFDDRVTSGFALAWTGRRGTERRSAAGRRLPQ